MAEWRVPGSDSEDESQDSLRVTVQLGGLKIPPQKLLELMKQVESYHTLELSSLSEVRRKRPKKKVKKSKHSKHLSPTTAVPRSGEEVSETASEVRSTTSTTATDYRESRRANLLNFDPLNDPELNNDAELPITTKLSRRPRVPPKPQQTRLASLDKILEATSRRQQVLASTTLSNPPPYDPLTPVSPDILGNGSREVANKGLTELKNELSFRFDDDSDEEGQSSEMDMKLSLMSQLNRVEQILDAEGLT